ncbi:MAG TPA: hypothetical protein VKY26_02665 [Actinomycetota bacterium]|nr:hypothetical protein [Actinomycetota bacterium]
MIVLDGFLYSQPNEVVTSTGIPAPTSVLRLDPGTGRTLASSIPLDPGQLAVSGNALWLASQTTSSVTSSTTATLYRLDPESLTVSLRIALPTSNQATTPSIAGTTDGSLWVASGTALSRFDSESGALRDRITVAGELNDISLSGSRLFDSLQEPSGLVVVEQRDAASGRLQARRDLPSAIAGAQVVGSSTGVWVSYRGGMMGSTFLLEAGTLADGPVPSGAGSRDSDSNLYGGMMGSWATIDGGVLWITRIGHFTCADPRTGAVRATETLTKTTGIAALVVLGHELLAIAQNGNGSSSTTIDVITPPSACWGP